MCDRRTLPWGILALLAVLSTRAIAMEQPPSLTPEGGTALPLSGRASRLYLLGAVELYSIGVYAQGSLNDRTALSSADASKALRIDVKYQDDLRRRVAIDWRRELVPQLESAAVTLLRGTFAALKHGDVVVVEYVPSKGTTVRVNNRVAVSEAGHELMLAFLDHWLGQRPVSDEIKRELLTSLSPIPAHAPHTAFLARTNLARTVGALSFPAGALALFTGWLGGELVDRLRLAWMTERMSMRRVR